MTSRRKACRLTATALTYGSGDAKRAKKERSVRAACSGSAEAPSSSSTATARSGQRSSVTTPKRSFGRRASAARWSPISSLPKAPLGRGFERRRLAAEERRERCEARCRSCRACRRERAESVVDCIAGPRDGTTELRAVAQPHGAREPLELVVVARQEMRLQAGHPLNPVLELTQQRIPFADGLGFAVADEAAAPQARKRVVRVFRAHVRLASAPDELERLNERFRFADPAGSELEIAFWVAR